VNLLDPKSTRILIISPAKDEDRYIERTIRSLVAQSHRPALWIIVDDGSSDRTGEIAERAAAEHPWIRVLRRPAGTGRRVGPGVIEAFYAGLETVDLADFDFVCKLDADLELPPDYFADLMRRFAENPRLGTASGKAYVPVGDRFVLERSGDDFSHGVAKLYRRECFEQIGGFVREVMWDGIDCHRCRMLGWEAVSYDEPGLAIHHLRLMGSSHRSVFHGRLRWGRGQYFMGTHPLYLLGITAFRTLERPWIVGGLCILAGYAGAWLRGQPRYEDPGFRKFLRTWQLRELRRRLVGERPPTGRPRTLRKV
jgi:biofilm PGA synthesis N-glycosyltransferase PgaC